MSQNLCKSSPRNSSQSGSFKKTPSYSKIPRASSRSRVSLSVSPLGSAKCAEGKPVTLGIDGRIVKPEDQEITSNSNNDTRLKQSVDVSRNSPETRASTLDIGNYVEKPVTPEDEEVSSNSNSEVELPFAQNNTRYEQYKNELKKQLLQDLLKQDDEMTITTFKFPLKTDPKTVESSTRFLIGDSNINRRAGFEPDAKGYEGDGQDVKTLIGTVPKRNWCFIVSSVLTLIMLGALLSITVLINYRQLIQLYHGEIIFEKASSTQKWYVWIATIFKNFISFLLTDF
ncbi:uncharacterized protein LOC129732919 [Wyeomyia smithii]|uniref:uncharacterized protein LOC129732919 n=1 Tax=Wyeomyia smithii TaxID=174621 RepID=UPI002467DE7B|nr:uncharacterized protein LOC129732919 [Wyeomyia smithii]